MFQLVDTAPLAPCGCMICGSRGPKNAKILDLMQEFSAQQLRLYLCKTHSREVCRAWGWVKGERMEELDKAAEQIVEIEQSREEALDVARKLADEVSRLQQRVTIVERERDEFRDREEGVRFRLQQIQNQANELLVAAGSPQ